MKGQIKRQREVIDLDYYFLNIYFFTDWIVTVVIPKDVSLVPYVILMVN